MATVYLNASIGNDSNTYAQAQNPATPWLTFGKVNTSATSGDTVICAAGTYTLAQVIWTKSFTITGAALSNNSPTTIISGLGGSYGGGFGGVWQFDSSGITLTISNLRFTNFTITSGWAVIGTTSGGSGTANITNCQFDNIYYSANSAAIIGGLNTEVNQNVTSCLFYGITTNQNSNIAFISNYFTSAGKTVNITNCTFYQGAVSAPLYQMKILAVGGTAGTLTFKNNIFYTGAPTAFGGTVGTFNNNDTYNFTSVPSGTGNITSDPLFISPSTNDFRLRQTSPCIETGVLL